VAALAKAVGSAGLAATRVIDLVRTPLTTVLCAAAVDEARFDHPHWHGRELLDGGQPASSTPELCSMPKVNW